MFDFIEKHKKILLIIAAVVIAGLLIVLLLLQKTNKVPAPSTGSTLDYSFLEDNISEQDKYLNLLAIIHAENLGTYSYNDIRPLQDLYNQSTQGYKQDVQKIMDAIQPNKSITTIVDGESVKLEHLNDIQAKVDLDGVTTDQSGEKTYSHFTVLFVHEGDYWLVENITIESR